MVVGAAVVVAAAEVVGFGADVVCEGEDKTDVVVVDWLAQPTNSRPLTRIRAKMMNNDFFILPDLLCNLSNSCEPVSIHI